MNRETIQELAEVGSDAVTELKRYFRTAEDDSGKKADRALKLLGRINGVESTQLKALALQFQVAKAVGIKGEALRPLLTELAPAGYASAGALQEPVGALAPTGSAA